MRVECDHHQELRENEVPTGRFSTGSEVVMLDEHVRQVLSSAPQPTVANVTQSTRVHIGPKFDFITQNVTNTEVVKDLPFTHYIKDMAKNSTKAERVSCGASITALVVCIVLIVYFTSLVKSTITPDADLGPHEWYITRKMWLSSEFNNTKPIEIVFQPLRLVIIAHTVSQECHFYKSCVAELRNLQSYFIQTYHYDIPYNFLIGNDGRVYEGVGWNLVGVHTRGYNNCSLGVAFIGDYREGLPSYSKLTPLQIERAQMLFNEGVRLGHLAADYHVVGAKDLQNTISPGENVYNAIQQWDHYSGSNYNKTCEDIRSTLRTSD